MHAGNERALGRKAQNRQVIQDAMAGRGPAPQVRRYCSECGERRQDIPVARIRSVHLETALDGLRPDVLLVGEANAPLCAVEVFHRHAVGTAKAERLQIPWVELLATQVLDDPLVWFPSQDHLKSLPCGHRVAPVAVPVIPRSQWPEYRVVLARDGYEDEVWVEHYKSMDHALNSVDKHIRSARWRHTRDKLLGRRPFGLVRITVASDRELARAEWWYSWTNEVIEQRPSE